MPLMNSQMKFSKKIFLAIFATATISGLIVCLSLYGMTYSYRLNEFKSSYIDHMHMLGVSLERVEAAQGQLALSAANAIREMDQTKKGHFSSSQLQDLAKVHGVSQISIFNPEGQPIVSTLASSENLFTDCSEPRKLLMGEALISETPLISKDGFIARRTMIASTDRQRIIRVSVQFQAVTSLLGELAQYDPDNEYIELIGPNNTSLGQLHRKDLQDNPGLKNYAAREDGAYLKNNKLVVISSMRARSQNFCTASSALSKDGNPTYRLITSISTQTFTREVQRLAYALLAMWLVLMAFSYWLSGRLTKFLLRKIESIRSVVNDITVSQDYSKRISIPSSDDELDDLAEHFNQMFESQQAHQSRLLEAERDKARSQVAAQVAHDIRSPLMSMNMALNQIQTVQIEALAILKSAVQRVAGIAQKLSASASKQEEVPGVEAPKLTLLEPLIASVVNEQRVKNPAHQIIELEGIGLIPSTWAVVQVIEVQTALSNLINNAFEAGASEVRLSFNTEKKNCILKIADNGRGIPKDIIEKIFERSFTFGKKTGTGLGLYQAKTAIEWSGGSLNVASTEGQGTVFTIEIPREKNPSWLPAVIEVDSEQILFFVDDDKNVLNAWKDKVTNLKLKQAYFLSRITELEAVQKLDQWPSNALLVIDQNLMNEKNGLDIIANLNIGKRAYLCTSEFDEKWIQDKVRNLNSWLLPKPLISSIEIRSN